jgi:hypothetical protein
VYNHIDRIFVLEKEFYVHDTFGETHDMESLGAISYVEGILYCNNGAYLLQPKVDHGDGILVKQVSSLFVILYIAERYIFKRIIIIPSLL